MTEPDILLAPGCFGAALSYSDKAHECITCPYKASCEPEATQRLHALRVSLGVYEIKKPRPKGKGVPSLKPKEQPVIVDPEKLEPAPEGLPVKVVALIERVRNRGIDVAAALARGVNPFKDKPAFLRVACDMLIAGGFDRPTLRTALIQGLEWSYGTANAHVAQVFSAMIALNAAEEIGGVLKLKGQG